MTDVAAECFLAPIGTPFRTGDCQIIERPGWYQVLTPSVKHPGKNEVIYSVVDRHVDRIIDETCAQYDQLELPFKWCLGPLTQPTDMVDRLSQRNFATTDVRGMYCDPAALVLAAPEDVTVRRVGAHGLNDYLGAFFDGWQIANTTRAQLTADITWAHAQSAWRFFVAEVDGAIAASACIFVKQHSGYLMGGNVLPAFRGRGVYRALLRARLRMLAELNLPLATTQAREATSAPILERLGFATAYRGHVMLNQRAQSHL